MGNFLKIALGAFNIINLVIGLFMIILSSYFLVTLWLVNFTITSSIFILSSILLTIGLFIITYSSLSFHGLRKRNTKFLKAFSVLVLMFLVLQISALVVGSIFRKTLVKSVDELLTDALVDEKEYMGTRFVRYMDILQYSLSCCGKTSYLEYSDDFKALPKSCCRAFGACNNKLLNTTGIDIVDHGCFPILTSSVSPVLFSVVILVIVIEILMAILGLLIKFNFISIGKFINENARGMNTMMSMQRFR